MIHPSTHQTPPRPHPLLSGPEHFEWGCCRLRVLFCRKLLGQDFKTLVLGRDPLSGCWCYCCCCCCPRLNWGKYREVGEESLWGGVTMSCPQVSRRVSGALEAATGGKDLGVRAPGTQTWTVFRCTVCAVLG